MLCSQKSALCHLSLSLTALMDLAQINVSLCTVVFLSVNEANKSILTVLRELNEIMYLQTFYQCLAMVNSQWIMLMFFCAVFPFKGI